MVQTRYSKDFDETLAGLVGDKSTKETKTFEVAQRMMKIKIFTCHFSYIVFIILLEVTE